jgi:hypothetical protein
MMTDMTMKWWAKKVLHKTYKTHKPHKSHKPSSQLPTVDGEIVKKKIVGIGSNIW